MKKYLAIVFLAIMPLFLMPKADSIKMSFEVTDPPVTWNISFPTKINLVDGSADFEIYIDNWSGFFKDKCLVIQLESDLKLYISGEKTETVKLYLGLYTGEKYMLKIKAVGIDGVHELTTNVRIEEPSYY